MILPTKGSILYQFEPNLYTTFPDSTTGIDSSSNINLRGGGIRIKSITHYDSENPNVNTPFAKKFNFNYNIPSSNLSSGSLVYPEPIYTFSDGYIRTNSNKNLIPSDKTKGGDVGYEYVTVYETGNGKTEYKMRSPKDFPNDNYSIIGPTFTKNINYDYLRGQNVYKTIKNEAGNNLSKTNFDYLIKENEINVGANIIRMRKQPYKQSVFNTCFAYDCLQPDDKERLWGDFGVLNDVVGISLNNYIKSEQFPGGQIASLVQEDTIEYNQNNYIKNEKTKYADGSVMEKTYKYATDFTVANNSQTDFQSLIAANMISIPLITEIKNNGDRISKTETVYSSATNLLPSSVLKYDLKSENNTKEIDLKYAANGNLIEYKDKANVSTAIIWGYNQTQPIAKIEGATYAQVSNLATAIVTASDADASDPTKEGALIIALDSFRTALPGYQITTYTYNPLIGVTSITPPSGIREVYIYDTANRLQEIRDINGNILKSYEYKYKP